MKYANNNAQGSKLRNYRGRGKITQFYPTNKNPGNSNFPNKNQSYYVAGIPQIRALGFSLPLSFSLSLLETKAAS
jgi:hypothetical protein